MEKRRSDIFFDVPIDVGHLLVMLPALVASGLYINVFLGPSWMTAISGCLFISRPRLFADIKLRLKKL